MCRRAGPGDQRQGHHYSWLLPPSDASLAILGGVDIIELANLIGQVQETIGPQSRSCYRRPDSFPTRSGPELP